MRLKEIRTLYGKSGYEIAKVLDISPQYYYELEREEKPIKAEYLFKLADWYNVPVDELRGEEKEEIEPGVKKIEEEWPEVARVLRRSGKVPTEKERKRIAKIIELAIKDD